MEHLKVALAEPGLGGWVGAEVGGVCGDFGFDLQDLGAAEAVVRARVAGTPCADIGGVARRVSSFLLPTPEGLAGA